MRLYFTSVLVALCAVNAACGTRDLTRPKAVEVIKRDLFNPKALESDQQSIQFKVGQGGSINSGLLDQLHLLAKAGLFRLTDRGCIGNSCTYDSVLTESGKAKLVSWTHIGGSFYEIPTARKEFVEVTGISALDASYSLVLYTYRYVPTEFGKILDIAPSDLKKGRIQLQLFDDGWRVSE